MTKQPKRENGKQGVITKALIRIRKHEGVQSDFCEVQGLCAAEQIRIGITYSSMLKMCIEAFKCYASIKECFYSGKAVPSCF